MTMQMIPATTDERIDTYDKDKILIINEKTSERFYHSNYCEVDAIIDDKTGYVNVTRVLSKYGKLIKDFVRGIGNLQNVLLYAKHKGVFNTFNINEVQVKSLDLEDSENIYQIPYLVENRDLLINIMNGNVQTLKLSVEKLMEIYGHLPFVDMSRKNKGYNNELKGMYIHPLLIHPFARYASIQYELIVSDATDAMNKEIKIREISLQDKVSEYCKSIDELTIRHEKSQRGHNTEHPGCIILRLFSKDPDIYKVSYDTKERDDAQNWDYCFNNIYNPDWTCRLLKWYIKSKCWDDVIYHPKISGTVAGVEITNLDKFKNHLESVQKCRDINQPKFEVIIDDLKSRAKSQKQFNLKAKMFEVYCSMKYEIKLAPYETGERLSLAKNDNGLDLLSIDKKRMGQCKHYPGSKLQIRFIEQFLQFCHNYPNFSHELYVLDNMKISQKVLAIQDLDIKYVSHSYFDTWYNENASDIDNKFTQRSIKYNKDEYIKAEEWLRNELTVHDFIYLDDAMKSINELFSLEIVDIQRFGKLFSHLYVNNSSRKLPKDPNGKSILISIDKQLPDFEKETRDKERQCIINMVGAGSYQIHEVLKRIEDETGHVIIQDNYLLDNFRDMFVLVNGKTKVRYIEPKKQRRVIELTIETCPDKYREIYDFVNENISDKDLYLKINQRFHRFETCRSINSLIHDLKSWFEK